MVPARDCRSSKFAYRTRGSSSQSRQRPQGEEDTQGPRGDVSPSLNTRLTVLSCYQSRTCTAVSSLVEVTRGRICVSTITEPSRMSTYTHQTPATIMTSVNHDPERLWFSPQP